MERIDLDISLASIRKEVALLKADLDSIKPVIKTAFAPEGSGPLEMVGEIKRLQSEYKNLKQAAETLKGALKDAYDPRAIEAYAKELKNAEDGIKKLENAGDSLGVSLDGAGKKGSLAADLISESFGAITKAAIILAVIDQVVKFTVSAVKMADQVKKAQLSFAAFTGDVSKADNLLKELNKTAQKKFLNIEDVQQGAKALLGANFAAEKIPKTLERIADISAATGKDFGELATIFGKAKTQGTLFAEDINQLLDAGVPIIGEFAKQLGVSGDQVKKLASEGKIQFAELELAFANLTAQGGKFYGQAETGGATVAGAWQKLVAQLQPLTTQVGTFFSNLTQGAINGISSFINDSKAIFSGYASFFSGKGIKKFDASLADQQALEKDRAAYEKDLNERAALEDAARKDRNKKSAEQLKKEADAAAAAAKERNKLRIEAMKEGVGKELAQEDLRYKELLKQLKKYHFDSTQAEEQHQLNITEIIVKEAEREADKQNKLEELRAARGEFEKEQNKKQIEEAKKALEASKKNLEDIRDLQTGEVDIQEQNFKNYIDLLGSNGASKEQIQKAQLEFDKIIKAERIKAEIEFQQGLLALTDDGDQKQVGLIQNKIQLLQAQLDGVNIEPPKSKKEGGGFNLWKIIGLDPNDKDFEKNKKKVQEAASQIVDSIKGIVDARVEEAKASVEAADTKVSAAEDALNKEIEIAQLGFASNVDGRRKDVEDAKASRAQALEEQKKAQRQQLIIDSAAQASGIITSTVNIIKGYSNIPIVGAILGIAAALSLISFISGVKAKAKAISVQAKHGITGTVGKDGIIVGPSHDDGGVPLEVEGGEFAYQDGKRISIVKKSATAAHFDLLQAVNNDDMPGMRRYLEKITVGPRRDIQATNAAAANTIIIQSSGGTSQQGDKETHRLLQENNRLQSKIIKMEEDKVEYLDMGDYILKVQNGREERIKKSRS